MRGRCAGWVRRRAIPGAQGDRDRCERGPDRGGYRTGTQDTCWKDGRRGALRSLRSPRTCQRGGAQQRGCGHAGEPHGPTDGRSERRTRATAEAGLTRTGPEPAETLRAGAGPRWRQSGRGAARRRVDEATGAAAGAHPPSSSPAALGSLALLNICITPSPASSLGYLSLASQSVTLLPI